MNFIEKNTKKVALILCLATAGSAVTTVYAMENADGWHGTQYIENNKPKVGWLITEDGTFHLNSEGHMQYGWQTIDGEVFFFNHLGKKVSGVQVIDGHKYNFQGSRGSLSTGWNTEKTSYFDKYGMFVTGPQKIDGKSYNFDDKGNVQTNKWISVNGVKYYFTADGSMATSNVKIEGKNYNFSKDGTITKGWKTEKGEKYYFDSYGNATKGWKTINGKKYYFNKKGELVTDTKYAGYKLDKNGVATKIKEEKPKVVEDTDTSNSSSNSSNSNSNNNSSSNIGNAKGGVAGAALAQLGVMQDCTALVSNALASQGIYFHGWPAEYMSLGTIVSASQAQAGDLIYYDNAGSGVAHIAVYIGGGQAVHGGWNGNNTVIESAYVGSGPVFIRLR